jgi:molybdenum cofactor cytidylyltransferase
MICGIVLAAGLSQRMEGALPKQLLSLRDDPMVKVTVRRAEESSLDHVVVVTGFRGAEVAAAVAGGRARVVDNPDYRDGNMTSFRAGFAAQPDCVAYVVLLADMPGVTTDMIERIVEVWNARKPWAAVSAYQDGRAHPLLLSGSAMEQAVRMEGAKGVWRFLEAAPTGRVIDIVFDQPTPLDVNTKADYDQLEI